MTTAILCKLDCKALPSVVIHLPGRGSSARDIQAVEFTVNGSRTVIFNNHWKSRRGRLSESYRLLFAEALADRLALERRKDPHVRIVLLGDFNTYYHEAPLLRVGSTGDEALMVQPEPTLHMYNLWYELDPPNAGNIVMPVSVQLYRICWCLILCMKMSELSINKIPSALAGITVSQKSSHRCRRSSFSLASPKTRSQV